MALQFHSLSPLNGERERVPDALVRRQRHPRLFEKGIAPYDRVQHFGLVRVISSIDRMQAVSRQWLKKGVKLSLVPTMGALHAGHLSLVKRARREVGGRGVVVVTPTASGKTLCYNLPVLDSLLKDPTLRALYLFPTKALAQDQRTEMESLIAGTGKDLKVYTYDGDTPSDIRSK